MHLLMWILQGAPPQVDKEFWQRKCFTVRIPTLSWIFTVRILSQKIYFYHLQCQNEVGKHWCCQNPLYGQMGPCQNDEGDLPLPAHYDRCITSWQCCQSVRYTWSPQIAVQCCIKLYYVCVLYLTVVESPCLPIYKWLHIKSKSGSCVIMANLIWEMAGQTLELMCNNVAMHTTPKSTKSV